MIEEAWMKAAFLLSMVLPIAAIWTGDIRFIITSAVILFASYIYITFIA